ncbi:hypothetical protein [Cohnella fermenti]|uniref:Uncharacterized protein n=1 Tax=Cohnella fermenti TaxID=2565925 RepID=A0A4S4BGW6_9BACL|nr:hypothetical protein [Cohnella fermenti]THF73722.1 hypothetical protein E6C55_27925 [Cohnella fermenti]
MEDQQAAGGTSAESSVEPSGVPSVEPSSVEPKKISLAEAMKRKLEQKKQAQTGAKGGTDHYSTSTKKMKSQINKKPNNQKKRTGV